MIALIHWISAKRRLKEADKTIYMMGGNAECPPMVLAQRDMISHEVEYYHDELVKFTIQSLICIWFCVILFAGYTIWSSVK